jgi:hypothetical protein
MRMTALVAGVLFASSTDPAATLVVVRAGAA